MTAARCGCARVGAGLPLFRIRWPWLKLEPREDLGPDPARCISARRVVACRGCGRLWVRVRIVDDGKSEVEWLFPRPTGAPETWDWDPLLDEGIARGGWRGPGSGPMKVW